MMISFVNAAFFPQGRTHLMPTPDSFGLELQEDLSLPPNTLVAPIGVIREIRALLGNLKLNIEISWDSPAVRMSSDLFDAFNAWSETQEEESEEPVDKGLFN
jgi:hypothetical protein